MKNILVALALISALPAAPTRADDSTDTFKSAFALAKPENRYDSPDWFYWDGSMVKGDDGKYYLFHSRWPKKVGYDSWLTHSDIVVAVSDSPSGPWKQSYVALNSLGGDRWDAVSAYNPKIIKFGDTYHLYYCATRLPGKVATEAELFAAGSGQARPVYVTLRNAQRTGVATSKSLKGPWVRMEKPCVEPAPPVLTLTVNPAVVKRPEGGYLMIVKGDKFVKPASPRVQGVALADKPEGPFVIQKKTAISDFDAEDADIWWDAGRKRYYSIFHAHTHFGMITSEDGLSWKKAANYLFAKKSFPKEDGTVFKGPRMERPAVYLDEKGRPAVFIYSQLDDGRKQSAVITVPMR